VRARLRCGCWRLRLKPVDKQLAAGAHFASPQEADLPAICGTDGVGTLEDGTRVFFGGCRKPLERWLRLQSCQGHFASFCRLELRMRPRRLCRIRRFRLGYR